MFNEGALQNPQRAGQLPIKRTREPHKALKVAFKPASQNVLSTSAPLHLPMHAVPRRIYFDLYILQVEFGLVC